MRRFTQKPRAVIRFLAGTPAWRFTVFWESAAVTFLAAPIGMDIARAALAALAVVLIAYLIWGPVARWTLWWILMVPMWVVIEEDGDAATAVVAVIAATAVAYSLIDRGREKTTRAGI